LSPDLWVPGAAEPSLDDFVARVHRQIERYTATHTAERSHVEVELADGERFTLRSLSGEPGYGFVTLTVHADEEAEQLIVPVGAIRRIALGPADEPRRPGFALPAQKEETEPAA
jgi:hypothetical protein